MQKFEFEVISIESHNMEHKKDGITYFARDGDKEKRAAILTVGVKNKAGKTNLDLEQLLGNVTASIYTVGIDGEKKIVRPEYQHDSEDKISKQSRFEIVKVELNPDKTKLRVKWRLGYEFPISKTLSSVEQRSSKKLKDLTKFMVCVHMDEKYSGEKVKEAYTEKFLALSKWPRSHDKHKEPTTLQILKLLKKVDKRLDNLEKRVLLKKVDKRLDNLEKRVKCIQNILAAHKGGGAATL